MMTLVSVAARFVSARSTVFLGPRIRTIRVSYGSTWNNPNLRGPALSAPKAPFWVRAHIGASSSTGAMVLVIAIVLIFSEGRGASS